MQVLYAAPKFTIVQSESFSSVVGILALKVTSDKDTYGLVYGVTSVGPAYRSFSAGLAYGFVNGTFGKYPVITLGLAINFGK